MFGITGTNCLKAARSFAPQVLMTSVSPMIAGNVWNTHPCTTTHGKTNEKRSDTGSLVKLLRTDTFGALFVPHHSSHFLYCPQTDLQFYRVDIQHVGHRCFGYHKNMPIGTRHSMAACRKLTFESDQSNIKNRPQAINLLQSLGAYLELRQQRSVDRNL